ncbi:hypothetical protein EON66_11215 [archaeon]|nr:MAG: hypothetical protein EON66_11215 [archaeon]
MCGAYTPSLVHPASDVCYGDIVESADEDDSGEVDTEGEDWLAPDTEAVRREYADARLLQEDKVDTLFQREGAIRGLRLKVAAPGNRKRTASALDAHPVTSEHSVDTDTGSEFTEGAYS